MGLFKFDDSYDPNNLNANPNKAGPGKCVLIVAKAEEKNGQWGNYYGVTCTVIASDNENNVDKEHYQSFGLEGRSGRNTLSFAKALGLITPEEIAKNAAKGEMNLNLEGAFGKIFLGEIVLNKQGRTVIWNFYSPDDPKVQQDWPKVPSEYGGDAEESTPADSNQETEDPDDDDDMF